MSEEFFPGVEDLCMEIKVKMIYGTENNDIISQYVYFSKVYNEQRKLHGSTRKTVEETIRICKDANVLKEYLEQRKQEVVTMMMTLFDEEQLMKNHDASIRREEREQAIASIVRVYKKMNGSMLDAVESVVSDYGYSEEDATAIVQKYWNEAPMTINIQIPKED